MVSLKQYNIPERISLEILKQCSLNLAPELYIAKETQWHPLCCGHGNSYTTGPVLIKAKIPRFYLKQGLFTPNILMGKAKMIWEPCVFQKGPSVPLANVANGDICFFTERDWSQEYCHGNNKVGAILFLLWCTFLVPNLKNTAPIFLEVFLIHYFIV